MADRFDTTYRIRTRVGEDAPDVINLNLNQHYDFFDILSLHINQKNNYNMPLSGYGVVCGRVQANGGFGIENAKVSIFIPYDMMEYDAKEFALYSYNDPNSSDRSTGVRYNLLPSFVDEACHQDIGTMYGKDVLLDNDDVITIFEKYYKYTTKTNRAGDYMIGGVPVGDYVLHTDVDLSDIGALSQKPLDMIYKGYNQNQFENPSKFKYDTNLESLAQVKTQNKSIHVYPYWGDTTTTTEAISITRCDVDIDYKFEPTCVFMGSIITDSGTESINQKCIPSKDLGKMSNLTTGSGTIEMIRKTFNGKVEEFSIQGKQLIDENGTWCYQIPMNLDYVVTNEFGEMVPTDDPSKGIPTRSRVRFRVGITGSISGDSATKTAKFLIPNNPRIDSEHPKFSQSKEPDYEFGTFTKDESFKDIYWNKVYTVKSYIPRLQKRTSPFVEKHSGIKKISFYGENNPMPYNNIAIKFNFSYRFVCEILRRLMELVATINLVLSSIAVLFLYPLIAVLQAIHDVEIAGWNPFEDIITNDFLCNLKQAYCSMHISMSSFCDTEDSNKEYVPGTLSRYRDIYNNEYAGSCGISGAVLEGDMGELMTCIENTLAEENEVISYNFQNDWVNGVLYAPQWYRRIKKKKRLFFGLFTIPERDRWCSAETKSKTGVYGSMKLYQNCAIQRNKESKFKISAIPWQSQARIGLDFLTPIMRTLGIKTGYENSGENGCYGARAHVRNLSYIKVDRGIIAKQATKLAKLYDKDDYVYYYRPVEYDSTLNQRWVGGSEPVTDTNTTGDVKLLYATDLVLLGSLNNCDTDGIPQFFNNLPPTTYNMPPSLIDMSYEVTSMTPNGENYTENIDPANVRAEFDGANWGFRSWEQEDPSNNPPNTVAKADVNGDAIDPDGGLFFGLSCQFHFVLAKSIINMARICEYGVSLDQSIDNVHFNGDGTSDTANPLPPDGYVSYDEISDMDGRSMFASLNVNCLKTKRDERTGYPVYDIKYCYPANFDGSLSTIMQKTNKTRYKETYKLELNSEDYVRFRYGLGGVKFYRDGSENVGWEDGGKTKYNLDRFPIYENSFYFYFGLKPGQTAIDRFKKDFYSDCEIDSGEESSIVNEYVPNSWCSETGDINPDGYILFNINGIEAPYDIKVNNKNGDFCYKEFSTSNGTARFYTLYKDGMGSEYTLTEDGNLYISQMTADNLVFGKYTSSDTLNVTDSDGYRIYFSNGTYTFTFTDSNGDESDINVTFTGESLMYNRDIQNFTISNDELEEAPYNGYYSAIANATDNPSDGRRIIGGFIALNGIHRGSDASDDDIKCRVSIIPQDSTWYTTTDTSAKNYYYPPVLTYEHGTFTLEDPNMHGLIYNSNGGIVIGLPKSNKSYVVTVTEYCGENVSNNEVQEVLMLGDAVEYRMYVNGVDYKFIQKFDTAWTCSTNPYTYDVTQANGTLKGWTDVWNIGGVKEIATEIKPYNASGYVGEQIDKLNNNRTNSAYTWPTDYTYPIDNFIERIPVMTIDELNGNDAYVIINGAIYQRVSGNTYEELPSNPPLDYETYFNHLDDDDKLEIISEINNVISKRKAVAQSVQDGFWIMAKDESKSLEITYESGNLPVKYLVRYIPDDENMRDSYYTLDGMYDTNRIYGIDEPTITSNNNGNISYPKRPYYLAISNGINNTIPKTLGYTTQHGFTADVPDQRKMFGVHYVAKYIDDKSLRSWNRHSNIPYFGGMQYNDNDVTFDGSDPTVGRMIDVDGMLCGYLYNGVTNPDVTNDDDIFEVQTVGDVHIKMHEYDAGALKYPTKRLIYGTDGVYNGFILDSNLASSIPQQAIALSEGMDALTLTQGNWSYLQGLSTEDRITVIPSQTTISWNNSGGVITTQFSITVSIGGVSSIELSHTNILQTPIYDIYDGTTAGNYKMYNNSLLYHFTEATQRNDDNTITVSGSYIGTNPNPLILLGIKEDNIELISSPAYDITPIDCIWDSQNGTAFIVFGADTSHLSHWYLRNYDFVIMEGDNSTTVHPVTTLDTKTYNDTTYYGVSALIPWSVISTRIYIVDVLGIRYSIRLNS